MVWFISLILFIGQLAQAHIVGTSNWCIQTSVAHMTCDYNTQTECEKALQKAAKAPSFFKPPSQENAQSLPAMCAPNPNQSSGSVF